MIKFIYTLLKILVVLIFVLFAAYVYFFKIKNESSVSMGFLTLTQANGCCQILLAGNESVIIKKVETQINGWIYKQATEHNPPGDMLPDGIDDKIKQKVKETVNFQ